MRFLNCMRLEKIMRNCLKKRAQKNLKKRLPLKRRPNKNKLNPNPNKSLRARTKLKFNKKNQKKLLKSMKKINN